MELGVGAIGPGDPEELSVLLHKYPQVVLCRFSSPLQWCCDYLDEDGFSLVPGDPVICQQSAVAALKEADRRIQAGGEPSGRRTTPALFVAMAKHVQQT